MALKIVFVCPYVESLITQNRTPLFSTKISFYLRFIVHLMTPQADLTLFLHSSLFFSIMFRRIYPLTSLYPCFIWWADLVCLFSYKYWSANEQKLNHTWQTLANELQRIMWKLKHSGDMQEWTLRVLADQARIPELRGSSFGCCKQCSLKLK